MGIETRPKKRFILFIRDIISFIIYLLLFFARTKGSITLVYHSVGMIKRKDDPYKVNVFPEEFEKHLKVISKSKNDIDITFDDGYSNNFKYAFPLLKKYGLVGTFFIITDFLDGKITSEKFGGQNFKESPLTWDQVKRMDRDGMKFGSHSRTHTLLTEISDEEIKKEIFDSKKRIEGMLDHSINTFAYPFGNRASFNNSIKMILKEAGFHSAYINLMGRNNKCNDKFALKRIRINSEDGSFKLKMKIKGAYDWTDLLT